jgi:nitroreductase
MLSAADRGLGTCWIDLGSVIRDKNLSAEIGLPDDHVIVATIILGYPKAVPARPPRNEPVIHWVGPS